MQHGINKPFLFLSTAKEVSDTISQTFSKKGNGVCIFELKTTINNTKQGDLTVTTYYNIMVVLWQELDMHQYLEMKAPKDVATAEILEQDWVFELLAKPNLGFDEVRDRMVGKEPFPSLDKTFFYVSNEEDCKTLMIKLLGLTP